MTIILENTSQKNIRIEQQRHKAIASYFWDHYSYFAHERSLIIDDLKRSLLNKAKPHEFLGWQRVVDYQFSLDPLSAKGSILNMPGGRFNIGDIDPIKFGCFPALYLARNRDTAYREKFGLVRNGEQRSGLTENELLLTRDSSVSIITLQGRINLVLDLTNAIEIKGFFSLIKNIKLPSSLVKRANKLNISPSYEVKTQAQLLKSLLDPNWRAIPMVWDVPANSQIFGQIAHAAGIEAILYPSKITKESCLAVYPSNFSQSCSYVEISGPTPDLIKNHRLDAETYLQCM